jgi:hypothetical protein
VRKPLASGKFGGLDAGDAGLDRLAHDALGGRILQTWAEGVGAQTYDGDLET